jgi:hypothetical protein
MARQLRRKKTHSPAHRKTPINNIKYVLSLLLVT